MYGGISEIRGGDGLTIAVGFFLYGGISGICIGGDDKRNDELDVAPAIAANAVDDATGAATVIVEAAGPRFAPVPDDVVVDDADVCAVLQLYMVADKKRWELVLVWQF